MDSRFERLEKALTTLINSVNQYHPSTERAKELEAADEELTKGLEQGTLLSQVLLQYVSDSRAVQEHQINYLRIQKLRASSSALDAHIKDTLSSLASTRRDITTTHTTTFPPGPNYPVAYDELLAYARRISSMTMPPAGTLKLETPAAPEGEQTPVVAATPSAAPTPSQPQSPAVNGVGTATGTPAATQGPPQTQQSNPNTALPADVDRFINPQTGQYFYPFPLENVIRGGALAANQALVDRGIDPKGYDPAEEEERKRKDEEAKKAKEEQIQREVEERDRRFREERERRIREERERQQEEWRKGSVSGPSPTDAPKSGERKQFQFQNLDDLDDDDED